MLVIKKAQTFDFDFDWPKDVDKNLNHEIEFIVKSNKSSAENKIKHKTEQLLSKYNDGNNIHEYGKDQNEWTTETWSLLVTKIRFKKFEQTCCSSKLTYLLHVEKYMKTVLKTN